MKQEQRSLGDRMKTKYEDRTRYYLPARTYTIIRIDGKAFHNFTKTCAKPFDYDLMGAIDATAVGLVKQIPGSKLAYVQSDEISILITDFDTVETEAWFGGNIQKIASVSASIATSEFRKYCTTSANFDSRVFTIADPMEVENYLVWRQKDAVTNSIQMAARAVLSHKELDKKNNSEIQEMLFREKGINWSEYPAKAKRGRIVLYKNGEWQVEAPPVFTKDKDYLRNLVPLHPDFIYAGTLQPLVAGVSAKSVDLNRGKVCCHDQKEK
jgi:tRNA(His) guanylyltransferase